MATPRGGAIRYYQSASTVSNRCGASAVRYVTDCSTMAGVGSERKALVAELEATLARLREQERNEDIVHWSDLEIKLAREALAQSKARRG